MKSVLCIIPSFGSSSSGKTIGIRDTAVKLGWNIHFVEAPIDERQVRAHAKLWHPNGLILVKQRNAEFSGTLPEGLPTVFIDFDPLKVPEGAVCVQHDASATTELAVRELLQTGHADFAFVHYPGEPAWSRQRADYAGKTLAKRHRGCAVMRANGYRIDSPGFHLAILRFLSAKPHSLAVFAANDLVAEAVLAAARELGRSVPGDVAIVGVDDFTEICEHTAVRLSSVKPDFRRAGVLAASALDRMMRGQKPVKRTILFGPAGIVRRESSCRPGMMDELIAKALRKIAAEACSGLTAAEAAKLFPCSRRLAEIHFKKATGKTFLETIHEQRLRRAKELLSDPFYPTKNIAAASGFSDPNTFRRFFFRATGKSLLDYRRSATSDLD